MISQFFILSCRGNTLIFRDFRGDVVKGSAEIFYRRVKSYKGSHPPPIFHVEGTQFLFLVVGGLYFVCTTISNVSPVFIFELMNRIAQSCKDYCGILDEEAVSTNFALVYEIVDEMIDFGYPMCTSTEHLRDMIVNEATSTGKSTATGMKETISNFDIGKYNRIFGIEKRSVPSSAPNKPVLSDDKTSSRNDVYIDILERLSVTVSSSGNVVYSDIDGCVKVRSFLAGDPDIHMLMNSITKVSNSEDKYTVNGHGGSTIVLESCRFHETVRVDEFDRSSTLVFRPPAGETVVLKYHISGDLPLPFRVYPILEVLNGTQLKIQIKLSCEVPKMFHAVGVKLQIPVPKSTTDVKHDSSSGAKQFEYDSKQKCVFWKIPRMNGNHQHHASIRVTVPEVTKMCQKEISPLTLDFEFPMFVVSKLEIKSLKVQERNSMYNAMRWVRCITHSDSFVVRL